ncbi:Rho termination factor N-terminal domain-containing protein, partial [Sulfurihydrogenibium sp.]|uniref:Rho termination factor N-terminal domain-containing protein n=1 Tax=Sulfurihydrogenibium sp. TaxID=2053621 RepID=UPI00260894BB
MDLATLTPEKLKEMTLAELRKLGEELELDRVTGLKKEELIQKILEKKEEKEGLVKINGVLEVLPEGFGFIRFLENNYAPSPSDIYVSPYQIKKTGLKTGDTIIGVARNPKEGEKYRALVRIDRVGGLSPDDLKKRPSFDKLIPYHPTERFNLEYDPSDLS